MAYARVTDLKIRFDQTTRFHQGISFNPKKNNLIRKYVSQKKTIAAKTVFIKSIKFSKKTF